MRSSTSTPAQTRVEITLPESVTHLGAAVTANRELSHLLRRARAQLGGGTALAALWDHHRRSTDLDIMIPAIHFDRNQNELFECLRAILAREHSAIADTELKRRIVLRARDVQNLTGDIEIVRDQLGDLMRRREPISHGPHVPELRMRAEAPVYILAKKLSRMSRQHHERDHYDILYAAYRHWTLFVQSMQCFGKPQALHAIVLESQDAPDKLFMRTQKPVLDPVAPQWKDVLAPFWRAVESTITGTRRTPAALPRLTGMSIEPTAPSYAVPYTRGH